MLRGRKVAINVKLRDSVNALKQMISDQEGIPPDEQRLIFGGRQLHNVRPLGYYRVTSDSTIVLALRLHGGGKRAPESRLEEALDQHDPSSEVRVRVRLRLRLRVGVGVGAYPYAYPYPYP